MEMASSEVEMSSCQTFNCVLNPHERCNNNNHKKNKNKNNVRNIHVAFEKNLNVFVRDHLETSTISAHDSTKSVPNSSSAAKSSVSDHRLSKTEESQAPSSSPSLGSDPDPSFSNPGQPENLSRKETMPASSLVQIWEARTTQQPPSQNQSQIDSRTSSSGLENSESLNEESVKEAEVIQPIEEGNNEEEEKEIECDLQLQCNPPLPQDRDGIRVMDIIRKLSNDSELIANNENGSGSYDSSKDSQITEARCFPQVACSPRIRGRQALADLLDRMIRDREKELACILESHHVTKFTHRGRIQSTLRIRCYERCLAIQGRHRSKPPPGGSDLNRSPLGSGVMNHLRGKYKTNAESIGTGASVSSVSSRGKVSDKEPHKATEKKVMQETMEKKSGLKEIHVVNSATEIAKKPVLSDTSETKNGLKKSAGETIQKDTAEGRGEKREMKEKAVAKESLEGKGERWEFTKEKTIVKETTEGRGDRWEKATVKENVEGNALSGIAERVNLWNSEDKVNWRTVVEKCKTESKGNNSERVEKNDILEEVTKRILDVETAERTITTSRDIITGCDFGEKLVRRKKKADDVSLETKSKEIKDRNIDPKEATVQADSFLRKTDAEDKVLQETTANSDLSETEDSKNGLKKTIEKESKEEMREKEESAEGNTFMGIAEKVHMWNSKEKRNRRRSMDKGKGKTVGKANTETNDVLKEASRRISNVETAQRSITIPKGTSEKVVGTQEVIDRRESNVETTRRETEEKGRRKKDKDFASVAEVSASHVSREMTKEKNSLQHGEEMPIMQNSEAKSFKEIDRSNSQEAKKEEESSSEVSREKAKEKISLQQAENMSVLRNSSDENGTKILKDEEIKMVEREEKEENGKAAIEYLSDCDENQMEEEEVEDDDDEYEDYDHYYGEDTTDWIYEISKPRSHWEELRKERYLEVLNTESDKNGIRKLIESRTVSDFLTSDLRKKIDNLMISRVQGHVGVQSNQEEEEEDEEEDAEAEEEAGWEDECSARNQEGNETEEEQEKTNLEVASDHCSQSSSWSFRDQDIGKDEELTTSLSIPDSSATATQTPETQMISDLRVQMEQLQREMFELRNTVKSCIDMQIHFQKSITQDLSRPGSSSGQQVDTKNDPLRRKCCICSEMPVDSLLYRCGHMCTCLKCAHELQWSSKKCPICMAPIVDVVRAFLDS